MFKIVLLIAWKHVGKPPEILQYIIIWIKLYKPGNLLKMNSFSFRKFHYLLPIPAGIYMLSVNKVIARKETCFVWPWYQWYYNFPLVNDAAPVSLLLTLNLFTPIYVFLLFTWNMWILRNTFGFESRLFGNSHGVVLKRGCSYIFGNICQNDFVKELNFQWNFRL